jgi:hypothetical protein
MDKWMWLALVVVLGLFGALGRGCCVGCGEGYSDGERTGIVSKFSKKGLVYKSWEGELNCGGTRQKTATDSQGHAHTETVPNVWAFHASDEHSARIQDAMRKGEAVTIRYRQWWHSPITQDSDYDVLEVTAVAP